MYVLSLLTNLLQCGQTFPICLGKSPFKYLRWTETFFVQAGIFFHCLNWPPTRTNYVILLTEKFYSCCFYYLFIYFSQCDRIFPGTVVSTYLLVLGKQFCSSSPEKLKQERQALLWSWLFRVSYNKILSTPSNYWWDLFGVKCFCATGATREILTGIMETPESCHVHFGWWWWNSVPSITSEELKQKWNLAPVSTSLSSFPFAKTLGTGRWVETKSGTPCNRTRKQQSLQSKKLFAITVAGGLSSC